MVVLAHPTGNPNSHQAAYALREREVLSAFITAWFPSEATLQLLALVPVLRLLKDRLKQRRYEPLVGARVIDDVRNEIPRILKRLYRPLDSEQISEDANLSLMKLCCKAITELNGVRVFYAYEDCAIIPFKKCADLGIVRIYELPTAYGPQWHPLLEGLKQKYKDWLPVSTIISDPSIKIGKKTEEATLADKIIVPSNFVRSTLPQVFHAKTYVVPYGAPPVLPSKTLNSSKKIETFYYIYAGNISVSKGIPTLLNAWVKGEIASYGCKLLLAGLWNMSSEKYKELPKEVAHLGVLPKTELYKIYQQSHVLVFPSLSDGFGMVITEALAAGLPVIATQKTGGPDVLDPTCGKIVEAENVDALIQAMLYYSSERNNWEDFSRAARLCASNHTWADYRKGLSRVVLEGY
jgi:alpha-maltose-1-phosphate synthase